ncbi:unnamed protein product, partial [Brassica oleracea]
MMTLRALVVKGTLAFVGFKAGVAMYPPLPVDVETPNTIFLGTYLNMTKERMEAAERNMEK